MRSSRNITSIGNNRRARILVRGFLAGSCALWALLFVFVWGGALPSLLHAQAKNSSAPNYALEGGWVRLDLAGGGSFGGANKNIPDAQLTPAGKALLAQTMHYLTHSFTAKQEAAYIKEKLHTNAVVVRHPCEWHGDVGYVNEKGTTLTFNPNSSAFHMVVGKQQVIWAGEDGDAARIIWMDGRHLPNESNWAHPVPVSVGHWENGVLVVKTVGLRKVGVGIGVPGRGAVAPSTTLTERFQLLPGGKRMKITYTYSDPRLYVKPHTFSYTFGRALPPYALEDWCDPGNPLAYTSVGPPQQ